MTVLPWALLDALPENFVQVASMVLHSCRYMVRPTVGIVPSNASVNIKIYMVPQEKYTDELRGCKDRFLIHSIPVSTKAETDLHKVFSGQGRQDFRLKVLVVGSCTGINAEVPMTICLYRRV